MKTLFSSHRAAIGCGAVLGTVVLISTASAKPTVRIGEISDDGGLIAVGAQTREPLTERLAVSLQKYLEEGARDRYAVELLPKNQGMAAPISASAVTEKTPATRAVSRGSNSDGVWTIDGRLSRVDAAGLSGGAYLWTTRLFREDPDQPQTRRLAGSWSVWAESLRYLTANLRRDRRVNTQGAVGEFGERIMQTVMAPPGATREMEAFKSWIDVLSITPTFSLQAVAIENNKIVDTPQGLAAPDALKLDPNAVGGTIPNGQMLIGARYQMRLTPQTPGEAYLISLYKGRGSVMEAARDAFPIEAPAGRDTLIPASPIGPPREAQSGAQLVDQRDFVVILHRTDPQGMTLPNGNNVGAAPGTAKFNTQVQGDEALVRVVGGAAPSLETGMDSEIARLMTLAQVDPQNWSARRLTVRLIPARDGK